MGLSISSLVVLSFYAASIAFAKSWGFEDASVSVQGKGTGGVEKQKFTPTSRVTSPLTLGATDRLQIAITATENKKAKRPHQAFLTLQERSTGLEESFPFTTKSSGKGTVEITQKDLPIQLATSEKPLKAIIVVGSFGTSEPLHTHVFDVSIMQNQASPLPIPEPPVRYQKRDEIHHIFKADPKSPPKIITLVFTAIALATLPGLFVVWLSLGANLNHLSEALSNAPVAHALFLGSISALEAVFFLYYRNWTLFQLLPAAGALGFVAFLSGSRALSEVQGRRLAGKR